MCSSGSRGQPAAASSLQWPPHWQGLQRQSPHGGGLSPHGGRPPRPGQSGNGFHREHGFRPQTFREGPAHAAIGCASQGAAGMADPSQIGHPTASRARACPAITSEVLQQQECPEREALQRPGGSHRQPGAQGKSVATGPGQFQAQSPSQQIQAGSIPKKVNNTRQSPKVAG